MTEDPRAELVRRGFAAYESGDSAALFELFDPEIEVYSPADSGNPGRFHGYAGFAEWVDHWNEAWDEFRQEIRDVESIGDRHVVVQVHQTARGRGSGVEVEQDAAYIYELRAERVVYLAFCPDPDRANAEARAREAATA